MYGITETTVYSSRRTIRAADLASPGAASIGQALPDMQLYVVDATGNMAAAGSARAMLVPATRPSMLTVTEW